MPVINKTENPRNNGALLRGRITQVEESMEYTVVSAAKIQTPKDVSKNLILEVNNKITEGWKPVGGIAVDNFGLYQAMTK
ncbi:MAG TPA: hypothetical protein HPP97_09755 [Desulfuromonadales bacterium]|nr:hypothetical protein [Desulfuromonadales bacterium]